EAVESAMAWRAPYELELRALRADGTVRYCLARGYPETGGNEKVVRLYGSLQDITELKLTQKRIEHLNKVLRAIRDVNQLIVRERNRDMLIREGCRLLVQSRGYGSALIVLTDERDRPIRWAAEGIGVAFESLVTALEQGELSPCCHHARLAEKVVLVADRKVICGQCPTAAECVETDSLCIRLVHDGAAFGYLIAAVEHGLGADLEEQSLFVEIAEDLAYALSVLRMEEARENSERERKSLEAQLRQAQKMEAIGALAGGIAHDFNNILGIIFGYAQLAQMRINGLGANVIRDDLEEILKAAGRARDLVRQILTFARKSVHERIPVEVSLIINEAVKLLRATIPTTIDIQTTIPAKVYPVLADPTQIHQLIFNLCTNAVHAMGEEGGVLRIKLESVELDSELTSKHFDLNAGSYVKLSVEDTGCGISPALLDRIFDPFFTTKEEGKGTGMGLAVVHGIVTSYGGSISVDSRVSQGTTFDILLPAANGEVAKAAGVRETVSTGSEKILFVDDEESLTKLGKLLLTRLGYRVEAETNPMKALELFKADPQGYDLVISDMSMPGMTGVKLADELLKTRPDIPIIICTGFSEKIDRARARAAGISGYIEKPVSQKEISRLIRKVLDKGQSG
ncbi:MAG: ATP-binding protein, partial [Desulforhabdus sp.]|nr:ATP-binding protein [Desulforhabdus sp.]